MNPPPTKPLRIVTFNNIPPAFELTHQWATQAGHKVVLSITSPGPKTRRSKGYQQIAAMAGERNIELLITTRLKSVVTPILQSIKPDLIVSASFPWLLPPGLLATARLGAINLHPALLPAYRGPNALRQFYDASPYIGATLHWIDGSFDTGPILSQHRVALPRPCTGEAIFAAWRGTIMAALSEGAQKAIAGDLGVAQTEEGASYAAEFSEQEHWLDPADSAYGLQCKATALALFDGHPVNMRIEGEVWEVTRVDLVEERPSDAVLGSAVDYLDDGLLIQTGDGLARLVGRRVYVGIKGLA